MKYRSVVRGTADRLAIGRVIGVGREPVKSRCFQLNPRAHTAVQGSHGRRSPESSCGLVTALWPFADGPKWAPSKTPYVVAVDANALLNQCATCRRERIPASAAGVGGRLCVGSGERVPVPGRRTCSCSMTQTTLAMRWATAQAAPLSSIRGSSLANRPAQNISLV